MQSVRRIKHEAVPTCGSFEVRYADGRPSRFFHFGDEPARRLRPDLPTSEEAEREAKALARGEGIRQGRHEVKEAAFSWRPL